MGVMIARYLFRLIKLKIQNSNGNFAWQKSFLTKITLFTKPSAMKVSFSMLLVMIIFTQPNHAQAGFFSDLVTKVFGSEAQTQEQIYGTNSDQVHNSQTIPLLESSINPDMKNMKDAPLQAIIEDEALSSNNGPLGPSIDLGEYASSAKIITYTVKEGDTLEGVAKKYKISKSTILYSNADLKSKDLLKIGQNLTIIPIKGITHTVKKGDTLESIAKKYKAKSIDILQYNLISKTSPLKIGDLIIVPGGEIPQIEEKVAKKTIAKEEIKKVVIKTNPPSPQENINQSQLESTPASIPSNIENGQPKETIIGGYIWPFREGVGRVSQRLHGDQGYDFAAPTGTPIYSIQDGTVLIVKPTGYNGGYGKYVVVNFNDGRQAIFGHMSKVATEAGAIVKQGDLIGYVGNTGRSTGPHVHIGFHIGDDFISGPNNPINPYINLKINSTEIEGHD